MIQVKNKEKLLAKFEERLSALGVFTTNKNKYAEDMVSILGDDVPYPMALAISNFTMASFVGHFHYKMYLGEDNLVPTNIIVFILAKSGAKKTSSVDKLEKAIKPGLDIIEMIRKQKAEALAKETDTPVPKLMPLTNALSTVPGILANLNRFKNEGIGLPSLVVDEVATAIATNLDFIPNVEVLSQLFDSGNNKVKVLKDQELQSEEVKGMGMNGLLIGSEKAILDDRQVLKTFETEFISKLARRGFFVYPLFSTNDAHIDDVDEYMAMLKGKKHGTKDFIESIRVQSSKIAGKVAATDSDVNIITLSPEAVELWELYEQYCLFKAEKIPDEEEHRILEQQHRHWKSLKLAGVYCIWDLQSTIGVNHMLQAIYAAELTADDLTKFMNMAKREPYELLVDMFMKEQERRITLHELVKLKIVKTESGIEAIIRNANSKLGAEAHIEYVGGFLTYHEHTKVGEDYQHWASFKKVSSIQNLYEKLLEEGNLDDYTAKRTAKEIVAKEAQTDYICKQSAWDNLANLLCKNVAYIPFRLKTIAEGASHSDFNSDAKGGIRRAENICSAGTWIVFDIDESDIDIYEAQDLLQEYTYHMAMGSNPDNIYKYRIIMPFNAEVILDKTRWKQLVKAVAGILGLPIPDDLPQSQFFYGYEGRQVFSNKGESIDVASIVGSLKGDSKKATPISREGQLFMIEDRKKEFSYFYAVESGQGYHNAIFRVMAQCVDRGMTADMIIDLINTMVTEKKVAPRDGYLEHSLYPQMYERLGTDKFGISYEE